MSLQTDFTIGTGATATGGAALPATAHFMTVVISGTTYKIPLFSA